MDKLLDCYNLTKTNTKRDQKKLNSSIFVEEIYFIIKNKEKLQSLMVSVMNYIISFREK